MWGKELKPCDTKLTIVYSFAIVLTIVEFCNAASIVKEMAAESAEFMQEKGFNSPTNE